MDRDAKLEGLADARSFYTRSYAAPKRGIEQDDIYSGVECICRELFEIDDDGIGGQRHADHLARTAHAVQPVDRILEVVVAESFDALTEAYRLFGGPDPVRIEAHAVFRKRLCDGPIDLQFVVGWKHSRFHFVGRKPVSRLQRSRIRDHLVDGAHL